MRCLEIGFEVQLIEISFVNEKDFSLQADFHCRVNRIYVRNKIQAMYEKSSVKVKVELGSTFRETRDLPYIASILFARVKITCVRA